MSFLPQVDPFTGISTRYSFDEDRQELVIARTQDCTPRIDLNRAMYNDPDESWRKDPEKWMHVASIPNVVVEQWLKEGINVFLAKRDRNGKPNDHLVRVLRKLRDPDWRYLNVTPITIG